MRPPDDPHGRLNHARLLACPAPRHDFRHESGEKSKAIYRCGACGGAVRVGSYLWYVAGLRDARRTAGEPEP